MSGILNAIEVSSKGLSVQRSKMNTVAENMANVETTETPEGGPYRRKRVLVSEENSRTPFKSVLQSVSGSLTKTHEKHNPGKNIRVTGNSPVSTVDSQEIEEKNSFKLLYDPTHPHANEDGYVQVPDIDIIEEMVDMMAASRGYEANTVAISAAKKMANDALDI